MTKIIIYQKLSSKPVILTDQKTQDLAKVKTRLLEYIKENKIFTIETQNDILIIKPSEIQSILISNFNTQSTIQPQPDQQKSETVNSYEANLEFESTQ